MRFVHNERGHDLRVRSSLPSARTRLTPRALVGSGTRNTGPSSTDASTDARALRALSAGQRMARRAPREAVERLRQGVVVAVPA